MSIIDHAKSELQRVNAAPEFTALVISTLERFFDEYDSGGAVAVMAPAFEGAVKRLIAAKPLTALTGEADEWNDVGERDGVTIYQNRRCASVFKDVKDGVEQAYDIDEGRRPIVFPYLPERAEVSMPIFEIG